MTAQEAFSFLSFIESVQELHAGYMTMPDLIGHLKLVANPPAPEAEPPAPVQPTPETPSDI